MARIDKIMVSHRATAGASLTGVMGVKVNAGGSVVACGVSDALAVVCVQGTIAAGKPVSMLKRAELVEFGGVAGSPYYAASGGALGTAAASATLVGFTIEGDRLVISM